jgi:prepilin-type N-terminal cleavage/methylation domain-containing protein
MSRRRDGHAQAGFTLPELILGIALMTIFGMALYAFYDSSLTSARTHENQAGTQSQGRDAIEVMTRELRQTVSSDNGLTPPVASVSPTDVVFYLDPSRALNQTLVKPLRVRYRVTSGQLLREAATPVGAAPPYTYGAYGPAVVMANGVLNDAATPLFAATSVSGAAMAASVASPATRDLELLRIRLMLRYRTGNANSTLELTTDVAPRNPTQSR